MDWRRCHASEPSSMLLLLLPLLHPCPATGSILRLPVLVPPFVDNWELYPDGYVNDLLTKLTPPNSYTATLAMLGLVMAGTLGYLPVNLKDVANAIDSRKDARRRRHGSRGYPAAQALSRRRGGPEASRRRRRWRRDVAGPDPDTLRQLLESVDADRCLVRLICEAEAAGPRERLLVRESLAHRLIRSGVRLPVRPPAEWEAAARHSRRFGPPLPDCHLLTDLCPSSPLDALKQTDSGRRSLQESGHQEPPSGQ